MHKHLANSRDTTDPRALPARAEPELEAISSRLGRGRTLDCTTRARMEGAFCASFAHVRIHDDAPAGDLSRALDAHAFTLGEHIAFARGQFRPGTLHGDALLAHELAHVQQQTQREPLGGSQVTDASLEYAADRRAHGIVSALYAPALARPATVPVGQSGLRLSRCGTTRSNARVPQAGTQAITTLPLDLERQPGAFGPAVDLPRGWQTRVAAARTSAQRAALLEEALRPSGVSVFDKTDALSGARLSASLLEVFTSETRHINYDEHLNQKQSSSGRELSSVAAHTFQSGANRYIILGPRALQGENFYATRLSLSHELEHVRQEQAGIRLPYTESELGAWTASFIRDFHRTYQLRRTGTLCYVHYLPEWRPLTQYFAGANEAARDASVARIQQYYTSVLAPHPAHRKVFRFWIHRTLVRGAEPELARRLELGLGLGIEPNEDLRNTRTFACDGLEQAHYAAPSVEIPSGVQ